MSKNLTAVILASGLLLPVTALASPHNGSTPLDAKTDKVEKSTAKSHHKTSQKGAKTGDKDKSKGNAKTKAKSAK